MVDRGEKLLNKCFLARADDQMDGARDPVDCMLNKCRELNRMEYRWLGYVGHGIGFRRATRRLDASLRSPGSNMLSPDQMSSFWASFGFLSDVVGVQMVDRPEIESDAMHPYDGILAPRCGAHRPQPTNQLRQRAQLHERRSEKRWTIMESINRISGMLESGGLCPDVHQRATG